MSMGFGSVSGSLGEFFKIEVAQGEDHPQIWVSLCGLLKKNSEKVAVSSAIDQCTED